MIEYVKKNDILLALCMYCDSHIVGCGECPIKAAIDDIPVAIELPDEHGDLIDRDAYSKLLGTYIESKRGVCENKEFIVALQAISKQIKCVKAVIAAERKDDWNI